jgi:hypothetical protein
MLAQYLFHLALTKSLTVSSNYKRQEEPGSGLEDLDRVENYCAKKGYCKKDFKQYGWLIAEQLIVLI